ncbi:MAG: MFS transporter [Methanomassiliicoccales archaeon]
MDGGSKYLRQFDKRIWALFLGRIISATGFSIVIPFLSIYFHYELGVPMTTVGLVFLVSTGAGAIGQILGGEVADRYGRRRIMILAMASRAAIFLGISIIIAMSNDFLSIAALVTCSSFVGSLFEPASNAMVADVVEPSRRLEAYGLMRIGQNVGWTLGPLLGGILALWGYSTLYLLTALCCAAVAMLVALFVRESSRRDLQRRRISLKDIKELRNQATPFLLFSFFSIFLWLVMAQMSSVYSVFAVGKVGISVTEVGYLYALNGIMVVLIQLPIAHYIVRFRMSTVTAAGALIYALGYLSVALAVDFWALAGSMVVITMGEIITSPSSMNLVANMSPESERGRYMGLFGLFTSTGWSLGPSVGGVLYDAFSSKPLLLWGGVASFAIFSALGYLSLKTIISENVDRVGARSRA